MIFNGMQPERREMLLSGYQNGLHKGGSGDTGGKEQAAAQQAAIDLQEEQWNQTTANMAPYLNAGSGQVSNLVNAVTSQGTGLAAQQGQQDAAYQKLLNLSSDSGQADYLNNYYNSDTYKAQESQARNAQLASAEATGGLGSTSTQNALAAIAPQLGQQAYSQALTNQQNLFSLAQGSQQNYLQSLGNLVNMGQSAAANQASAGQSYANNTSSLLQGLGSIQAGQANQPSKAASALTGAATGAASGAMIGSAVPGIGTAIGAVAGGVIGGLGSLL